MNWRILSTLAQLLGTLAAVARLYEFAATRAFKKNP
jgi:hypothetical protein